MPGKRLIAQAEPYFRNIEQGLARLRDNASGAGTAICGYSGLQRRRTAQPRIPCASQAARMYPAPRFMAQHD